MSTAATEPPSMAKLSRQQLIRQRQRDSILWRIIHILGSLKLAMVLLATIAAAIAAATIFESSFNAKVARAYIYKAPWFMLWLAVLCVNLFAVTVTRWPWQRKHAGFIITHYGIILLLAGAMIGMQLGFEGNVTLKKNAPPVARITTSRSMLQVESPRNGALYMISFDAEVPAPSEQRPRMLAVPGSEYSIVVDAFSSNIVEEDVLQGSDDVSSRAGVSLRLASAMAGRTLSIPLSLTPDSPSRHDFFGLAEIRMLAKLPDRSGKPVTEAQMIFTRYRPVIQGEGGSTGIELRLSEDGASLTIATPDGVSATYSVPEVIGKSVEAGGATVAVRSYWPDFSMKDGKPATASEKPNNPALLAQVTGPGRADPSASARPLLEIAPDSGGTQVAYQLSRAGIIYQKGAAAPGATISLGWADWSATVTSILQKSIVITAKRAGTEPAAPQENAVPGFRARLLSPQGTAGAAEWVESGMVTTLRHPDISVRLAYGLELRPIPFNIRLLDFQVPRYEGTQTPSNFISTLEFRDLSSGQSRQGVAKMNHTASWPGGVWAGVSGINYKFSQAEWNPRDLDETTLQVLFDPGWMLKWIGSLGICLGITIMFYFNPAKRAPSRVPAPLSIP